jgi:hypothetical protein
LNVRRTIAVIALFSSLLTQGCGAIGKLHTQAGLVIGSNHGDEPKMDFSEGQLVAELGYVTGGPRAATPQWGFGGTSYLLMAEELWPGMKAIARRRFNSNVSLDLSAGSMITYNSSGLFNGFTGGLALNIHFVTLRSEYVTWPIEPWDEYNYQGSQPLPVVHHPSGHQKVWFNGVSMNGTASWVTVAIVTGIFIALGMSGAFE